MNIVFIYRVFKPMNIDPVVSSQIRSLEQKGLSIIQLKLKKGGFEYFRAILSLFNILRKNKVDIIHGHYSYCGFISSFTFGKKVFCSLMGSDIYCENSFIKFITKIYNRYIWFKTIVKSQRMKNIVNKSIIIPNGVDFSKFKPIDRDIAFARTKFKKEDFNIIFTAIDINAIVKNFKLAEKVINMIKNKNIKLHCISNKTQNELVYYYNAADLLLLTSFSEGSPNVIKEAMACNTPIISTDVGDVREITKNTENCYITSFKPNDIISKILKVYNKKSRTNGRNNIKYLRSDIIAEQLITLYKGYK